MKLHLGCGCVKLPGFVNIDIRYLPEVDVVDNIRFLRRYSNNSIDMIYSAHILEHFTRHDYIHALERWFEVLKPNGLLRIAVPDFEAIVKNYEKFGDVNDLIGLLYGGQDYEENFHHYIWDFKSLKSDLEKVGFTNVRKYDSSKTEYVHIHDCSQAYLPRMDKKNGMLMSLNVEANK